MKNRSYEKRLAFQLGYAQRLQRFISEELDHEIFKIGVKIKNLQDDILTYQMLNWPSLFGKIHGALAVL